MTDTLLLCSLFIKYLTSSKAPKYPSGEKSKQEKNFWGKENKYLWEVHLKQTKNYKKQISGITYRVTKSHKTRGTVEVYKVKEDKKTVKIPDKVTIDGITYKVTAKNIFS